MIGNPPYIRIQTLREWAPSDVNYYNQIYKTASKGNYDIYVIFIEKSLEILNINGHLGFILPHKFFNAQFAGPLRNLITAGKNLDEIIHFGSEQVFENATTYTCLIFLKKSPQENFIFSSIKMGDYPEDFVRAISLKPGKIKINLPSFPESDNEWYFFSFDTKQVMDRINKQSLRLGDITEKIFQGIATSADKIYVLKVISFDNEKYVCYSRSLEKEIEIEKGLLKPFLMGKDVHRYKPLYPENVVIFPYQIDIESPKLMSQTYIKNNFPKGWKYLIDNKFALSERERGRMHGNEFYAYIYPKNLAEFASPKILTPEIAFGSQLSIDEAGIMYHTTKVYSFVFKNTLHENKKYFLGILNSKILWFFIKYTGYTLRGGYFTFKTQYLNPFPIHTIDFSNPNEVKKHDQMVSLVEHMLELHKRTPQTPHEKERLKREIAATDAAIDRLVYELYGLTEEEIRIVEGNI